jgi:hypothetical protein
MVASTVVLIIKQLQQKAHNERAHTVKFCRQRSLRKLARSEGILGSQQKRSPWDADFKTLAADILFVLGEPTMPLDFNPDFDHGHDIIFSLDVL